MDHYKRRIVLKSGKEFISLNLNDIVYFVSSQKLVFGVDQYNKRYITEEKNLSLLEKQLNPAVFFRASRQYIININFLKSFKIIERSKIKITMLIPTDDIIVSQENAAAFKNWVS